MIQLHGKAFEPFISKDELEFSVANLAQIISEDFQDEIPVFIGVLNGSFRFLSDLSKNYQFPCEISFIKVASYEGTESTNEVKQILGINQDLTGRIVIIVEDIVDTGNTIVELKKMFKSQNVKHLKIATLFLKAETYKHDIKLDYVGIRIPNKFIVGYGLDYDGLGRNLNEVYQLAE